MFTKFTQHQEKLQLGFDMHSSVYVSPVRTYKMAAA